MAPPSQKSSVERSQSIELPQTLQQTPDSAILPRRAVASARSDEPIRGLYLHIPFCFHKCHYCDFYSIVDRHDRQAAFVERMTDELHAVSRAAGQATRLETLFVGGGTPTLLHPDLWRRLLDALHATFDLTHLLEWTVEANPETVTPELLDVLVAGGVNRLSIGAQTFNPDHLQTLERWHEPQSVRRAVDQAHKTGLYNLNLDLIFAIPGQSLADWEADLDAALALAPAHLSCYALTYEPHTPLTARMQRGRITPADEQLEAEMYERTIDRLTAAGFEHYEVSNFARKTPPAGEPEVTETPGSRRCRHNRLYWLNGQWLAVGPSASGHVAGRRWKNRPHLGRYLASQGGAPVVPDSIEQLDPDGSFGEQLMLRLRLIDGVPLGWLEPRLDRRRSEAIDAFVSDGLLQRTADRLRLTRRGLLIADSVLAELL